MFSRIAALPLWAKVLLAVAALIVLLLSIALSPLVAFVALLVLIVSIFALIYRILRRRPLRNWGLIALGSLLFLALFAGISNALYGEALKQASSPSGSSEEAATSETTGENTSPSETATGVATEVATARFRWDETARDEDKDNQYGHYDATVTVTRVVDGDTIKITPAVDGNDEVRLIGIDTPETKEPGCEVQPYGPEASKFTTSELQGKEVALEFDKDRIDPYDRPLAYVYKDDDEMFNETLLKEGYAQVAIFPPNDRYEDRFKQDQEEAKAAERGIWGLSASELAKLKDQGNGFGSDRCDPKVPLSPSPLPQPAPSPTPTPTPSTPAPSGSYPPISKNSCPPNAPIKGNQQSGIYHVQGGQYYNATNPEECFATEADAQTAGYRKSKR